MKHDFVKLAMAGLLAGFCVSATAATSAAPEEALTQLEQSAESQEIAMTKCTKDTTDEGSSCNGQADCSKSPQCKDGASSELPVQRKSAAQRVLEGN
jgi:hypothetical protein